MDSLTLFFRLNSVAATETFARAFGALLIAPIATKNPVVVAALGGVSTGKSLIGYHALAPLIGEERAQTITKSNSRSRKIKYQGGVYRGADFAFEMDRAMHGSEAADMSRFFSGTGGMVPRAPEGYSGVDWIEHPTLLHIARANYVLTIARPSDNNGALHYNSHLVQAMEATLQVAPSESEQPPKSSRRIFSSFWDDPRLEQRIMWNQSMTHYVRNVVIPQMVDSASRAKTLQPLQESKKKVDICADEDRVVGLTISSLQRDDASVRNFRQATNDFSLA